MEAHPSCSTGFSGSGVFSTFAFGGLTAVLALAEAVGGFVGAASVADAPPAAEAGGAAASCALPRSAPAI